MDKFNSITFFCHNPIEMILIYPPPLFALSR